MFGGGNDNLPGYVNFLSFITNSSFLTEQQLSKEEIKAGEIEAQQTVQFAIVGGILLYLSPFAIDLAKKFL
ncbi:conserved hypothetical protein [Talaromyces stipitatus ATCC 10500]|uniref:Mitochondrial outer membrane translocase complex, subunit Tom5 n=1 Tax=Talaromyces stipitatus (strain ATCC 10500 / CBS 375.48 / QM 6759 / NRRL 1006) TaxID=441959 RepID=B8MK10_TALSN|nr:uncharacterized protein TSTA_043010 [Talaromyces stipitatus ATCC 10500]EED14827.1 conserved hypothetical protein [Talaromyces stipitatus ATCC 10500]